MIGAMHFETWGAMVDAYSGIAPSGITCRLDDGGLSRWNGRYWVLTDTPALLRPDDPPWYREPTADKPGQVRTANWPGDGWEWALPGNGHWGRDGRYLDYSVVEARRIEPEPEPVTVPVEIGLLETMIGDLDRCLTVMADGRLRRTAVQDLVALSALIAEARR